MPLQGPIRGFLTVILFAGMTWLSFSAGKTPGEPIARRESDASLELMKGKGPEQSGPAGRAVEEDLYHLWFLTEPVDARAEEL